MAVEFESVELTHRRHAGGTRWDYVIREASGNVLRGPLPDADSDWTFSQARKHFVAWAQDYDLAGLTWTEEERNLWAAVMG